MSATHLAAEPAYYKNTETLPYEVVLTLGENIEIRQYPSSLAVTTSGNSDNAAFRLLFKYITGDNKASSNIAMTSPVEIGSQKIEMTSPVELTQNSQMLFFLPSTFNIQNAPLPTHPDVTLIEVPARQVAVFRYSGFRGDDSFEKHKSQLLTALEQTDFTPNGEPSYFGYDSPWTLPWNRRNEVILPVEGKNESVLSAIQ
ncbi:MAG: heme-binding protein [Pseudomonadota bacterium]